MKANFKIFMVATVTAFASIFIYDRFFNETVILETQQYAKNVIPTAYTYNTSGAAAPSDFTAAAEKTIDAVVHVKNTSRNTRRDYSFWGQFFEDRRPEGYSVGMGSGVIVSPDGYIITNNHVVENFSEIEVTTNDNKIYKAELVGNDNNTDIAVLKIKSETELPYIAFGDSDMARIGEWVLAVGNPFNLNSTVTAGIISAKSRDLNDAQGKNESYIQTDAAVNMGNSGGALINTRGELIGINTAISSLTGGYVGYSFAVPSNVARKVFEDILEYGNVQKVLLGISGTALNSFAAERYEVAETEGFLINQIENGMGAEKAGLKEGDIIKKVDDIKINKFADLTGYLATKHPGERVQVAYMRKGTLKEVFVELAKPNSAIFLNMRLKNLSSQQKRDYDTASGLMINEMRNQNLYRYGIEEGYVILEINRRKVNDIASINQYDSNNVESILFLSPQGEKLRVFPN